MMAGSPKLGIIRHCYFTFLVYSLWMLLITVSLSLFSTWWEEKGTGSTWLSIPIIPVTSSHQNPLSSAALHPNSWLLCAWLSTFPTEQSGWVQRSSRIRALTPMEEFHWAFLCSTHSTELNFWKATLCIQGHSDKSECVCILDPFVNKVTCRKFELYQVLQGWQSRCISLNRVLSENSHSILQIHFRSVLTFTFLEKLHNYHLTQKSA